MFKRGGNKKAQVTIFIILALVIVASVAGYFIFKNVAEKEILPETILPIQASFLSCIEEVTVTGISLIESSGGYIDLPNFKPGSRYMPFSSQLTFAGREIPYWYYITGSNMVEEQIPLVSEMEYQLEKYLEGRIINCNLDAYIDEGFLIMRGTPSADIKIKDESVEVNLEMNLDLSRGVDSFLIRDHNVEVNSNLGKLHSAAVEIYEKEQKDLFLENYSVDVLRLYAPVDGVELSCSPKVWSADVVFEDLKEALEINVMALKNIGDKEDYFVVKDLPRNVDVNFISSKDWPMYLEVNSAEGNSLIANPVGNQQGLGLLGFCYVPYHFVYNVRYPVLVQVSEGKEIFQYPLVVLIEGNLPRKVKEGASIAEESINLCENKNTLTTINVYDTNLDSVDANILYNCFGSSCNIGKTENGELKDYLPQCVNGQIIIQAEGYKEAQVPYSSIEGGNKVVVLDKEYEKEISLFLDGREYLGDAIISFVGRDSSQTIVYPENTQIILAEGNYEIQVSIYEEANLNFVGTVQEQCLEVPRSGIGAIFGLEKEECFEVEIPEQIISTVLIGGGMEEYYFLESELIGKEDLVIEASKLNTPTSLEELQQNYILFEVSDLGVSFK